MECSEAGESDDTSRRATDTVVLVAINFPAYPTRACVS